MFFLPNLGQWHQQLKLNKKKNFARKMRIQQNATIESVKKNLLSC